MQKTVVGDFLCERGEKYKSDNEKVVSLKRIDKIDFSGNFYLSTKASRTDMIVVCPGDFVISGINVAKGAMGIYQGNENIAATIHYSSYIFDDSKVDVEYFKRFLKSPEFIRILNEQVKGGIKTEIKPKHILPLTINLPIKSEQKKTVQYIKKVETVISQLQQEIEHQKLVLRKLRWQILQDAIQGVLTEQRRIENLSGNSVNIEKTIVNKVEVFSDRRALRVFDIPFGWNWCRVGDVLSKFSTGPFGSMLHKSDYVKNGIPLVNPKNIIGGKIVADDNMMINEETKKRLRRYILQSGEIVIARRGDLSKCALVERKHDGWLCGTGSFSVRFSDDVDPEYFTLMYRSRFFQQQLADISVGQTMANLNQKLLKNSIMPLPPYKEQKAIVAKTKKLLNMCDLLQAKINENATNTEELVRAISREVFSHNQ